MIIRHPVDEDVMVRAFLRAEIASPRFSQALRKVLARHKVPETIITNQDPGYRTQRLAVLREHRPGLFRTLPLTTLQWLTGELESNDWLKLFYLNLPDWVGFSGGTRLITNATKKVGEPGHERIAQRIREITHDLASGKQLEPLIIVSNPSYSKLVVMEGHVRATAYASLPQIRSSPLPVIVGVSDQIEQWGWY